MQKHVKKLVRPGSGDSVTSLSGGDQKNLPVKGTENGIDLICNLCFRSLAFVSAAWSRY